MLPHNRLGAELYDLGTDPSETKDVLAEHPEVAQRLQEKASAIVLNGRTTQGPRQPNDTGYWSDLKWITPAEYERAMK